MLYRIGREKLLTLNAVVGIFPAFSRGDDIVVEREGRKVVLPQPPLSVGFGRGEPVARRLRAAGGEGDDYVCLLLPVRVSDCTNW